MYFDAKKLPRSVDGYAVWIDLMGMQSMAANLTIQYLANYVGRLQTAARNAYKKSMTLKSSDSLGRIFYVMDGVSFITEDQERLETFVSEMMKALYGHFQNEADMSRKFLIRGAISFGRIVSASKISSEVSRDLSAQISDGYPGIVLGLPLVRAFVSERNAGPFGIYIDDLAREFAPWEARPLVTSRYEWWGSEPDRENIRKHVLEYLEWAEKNSFLLGYPAENIRHHVESSKAFFAPGVVNLWGNSKAA